MGTKIVTYLTTKDLAERWGITPEGVRQRKLEGKLPPPDKRFGNANAWLEETIEGIERDERVATDSAG